MQPFPQEEPIDLLRRDESLLSCFCQSNEKKSFYLFFLPEFFSSDANPESAPALFSSPRELASKSLLGMDSP